MGEGARISMGEHQTVLGQVKKGNDTPQMVQGNADGNSREKRHIRYHTVMHDQVNRDCPKILLGHTRPSPSDRSLLLRATPDSRPVGFFRHGNIPLQASLRSPERSGCIAAGQMRPAHSLTDRLGTCGRVPSQAVE